MNEAIREIFLTEWVESASKSEIVEKLIEHDERAKQIIQLKSIVEEIKEYIEDSAYQISEDVTCDLIQIIDKGVKNE